MLTCFLLDDRPHVDRIEAVDHVLDDDGVSAVHGVEPEPVPGTVHERGSRHETGASTLGRGHDLLDRGELLAWSPGCGRRAHRRRCRPAARAPPWACRWFRRCRGCRGRRATSPSTPRGGRPTHQRGQPRTRRRRAAGRCPSRRRPGSGPRAREDRRARWRASARTPSGRRWPSLRCCRAGRGALPRRTGS